MGSALGDVQPGAFGGIEPVFRPDALQLRPARLSKSGEQFRPGSYPSTSQRLR
jgi:hypothetical protein